MPTLLAQDLDRQNICCNKAFQYFKDKKTVTLPYRRFVRLKISDTQLMSIGLTLQKIYADLDKEIEVPLELLDSINFKYTCDDLCPFPDCLENLKCWEIELILHWSKISELYTWIDVGLTLDRVSKMYNVDIEDLRRWNQKRKKITDRGEIYKGFQGLLKYLQP